MAAVKMDHLQAIISASTVALVMVVTTAAAWQTPDQSRPAGAAISSLRSIPVPQPPDLARYIREEAVLVVLGKALFWDTQLSSDNTVACASCHFHAGADHRPQNQLSAVNGDVPPNQLLSSVLPFSHPEMEAGWRVASAGVLPRRLIAAGKQGAVDQGIDLDGAQYANLHGANVRQVSKRNAPSVINAVYNVRQFWDGRASETFNGQDSTGDLSPTASVLVVRNGTLSRERISIKQSGLASQALEPPLDDREMSYQGRTWPMLGRKMLGAQPLRLQRVAPDDSILGKYVRPVGPGLSQDLTYLSLIRTAFRPEYWSSEEGVDGFSQAESNFALFFGLAIQAYESTLVSDDTPYDRYLDGKPSTLSPPELEGLAFFQRRLCATCHVAPELTLASYRGVYGTSLYGPLGPDAGFFYTGVEPIPNDIGLGGLDRFGGLLSAVARQRPEMAQWMRGFFKTPSLRNVELTGPYFHTGSKTTLGDVILFYTFGGDHSNSALVEWGPDPRERVVMPAFLKALTDDRVRYERAPFDHPELCVSVGHVQPKGGVQGTRPAAPDRFALVPAVGARGNHVPLQTFEELLQGIGRDGSRAHALTETCQEN